MTQIRTVTVTVQVGDDTYQLYPKLEPMPPRHDFNVLRSSLRKALAKVDPRAYAREQVKRLERERPKLKELDAGRDAMKIVRNMERDTAYEKGLLDTAPWGYWKRRAAREGKLSDEALRAAHARAHKRKRP